MTAPPEIDVNQALVDLAHLLAERQTFHESESVDGNIFRELFEMERSEALLERIARDLRQHRRQRDDAVRLLRVIACVDRLHELLPDRKELPPELDALVIKVAREHELILDEACVQRLLKAAARQRGENQPRVPRMVRALLGQRISPSRIGDVRSLLKQQAGSPATRRGTMKGKVKRVAQLTAAQFEGIGTSAVIAYALPILGAPFGRPVEEAVAAWSRAFRKELGLLEDARSQRPAEAGRPGVRT